MRRNSKVINGDNHSILIEALAVVLLLLIVIVRVRD
jgi:hypothetical protein